MRPNAKPMAYCAMTAALCVVLMVLGAVLELGMYAAPLFAGLCLIPIGQKYGRRYQITLYIATGLLCLLFVPNVEQNLLFIGLFGWYPMIYPMLQKLPGILRLIIKLLIFNVVIVAVEWLVIAVLVPDNTMGGLLWVLLLLANITFLLYDRLIPRVEHLLSRLTKRM